MALTCDNCLRGDSFRCRGNGCANSVGAGRETSRYRPRSSRPVGSVGSSRTRKGVRSRTKNKNDLLGEAVLDLLRTGHSLEQIGGRLLGAQSPVPLFEEEFGHEHAPYDPHRRLMSAVRTSLCDDKNSSTEWVLSRISGDQMPTELLAERRGNAEAPDRTSVDASHP